MLRNDAMTDYRELSERLRTTDRGVTIGELHELFELLTPEQVQRIRDKQRYERCSALAVLADWPNLFEPETTPSGETHG